MNTQIVFKIDTDLKMQASEKAQQDGLPLAFVLRHLVRAYVSGDFHISLVPRPDLPKRGQILQYEPPELTDFAEELADDRDQP